MLFRMSRDKAQLFSYFFFISFAGAALLCMPWAYSSGHPARFIDALFISVSAVCVTGLSTLNMNLFSPAGFIVIMALIETGGLGIITFVSMYLVIPRKKVSLVNRSMISDFYIDDVEFEPRRILRNIITLTVALELLSAFILFFCFKNAGSSRPFLDAIFHSVSAFCNAGFSTYNDSLAGFMGQPILLIVVLTLIVLGGIGFMVITDVIERLSNRKTRLSLHTKIVLITTFGLIFGGTLCFFLLEGDASMKGFSIPDRILASLFQSITPRTAGFEVVSGKSMTLVSSTITIILMFIGGSPGSIAGGIKTTTFFIVFLYAIRGNAERGGINVMKRNIDTGTLEKALGIIIKSLMIVVVAILALLISESGSVARGVCSELDLVFETVSAFGTVGLSLGATPNLTDAGKIIIICTMFIGRTGIFAMALGSVRRERERYFEYPSANIMVG